MLQRSQVKLQGKILSKGNGKTVELVRLEKTFNVIKSNHLRLGKVFSCCLFSAAAMWFGPVKLSLTLHRGGAGLSCWRGKRSHLCAFFSFFIFFPPLNIPLKFLTSSLFLSAKMHSHLWPRSVDLWGAHAVHKPPPREESHQCHRCDTEGIAVAGPDHCALGKKRHFHFADSHWWSEARAAALVSCASMQSICKNSLCAYRLFPSKLTWEIT